MAERNLWENSAKETFQASVLTSKITTDLVIIGGGYTGLSAAIEAANQGASVALLEAKTIGFGGSGRNVGLVNAGLWLPPETVLKTMGEGAGKRLNQVLGGAPNAVFDLIETHSIACEAVQNGTLHCAHSKRSFHQLQDRFRQLKNTGAPVTLLNKAAAEARTGSQQVFGALCDRRAGTIQPLSYARGLARAATSAGAHIYENSQALSASIRQGIWHVITAQGEIQAPRILMATNAYHQDVGETHIAPVTTVNFFQLATDPLDDALVRDILPEGEGCWDTGAIMTSFRKDAANRFIIGGIGKLDNFNVHRSWARRAMEHLYPQLKNVGLSYAWSGRISMPADHIPKVSRLGSSRGASGYAMFGYSGRGIGPGTVMGQSLARAILAGEEHQLPISPIDQYTESFTRGKSVFYEIAARVDHAVSLRIL